MKHNADLWNKFLLWSTGSKLKFSKYGYHVVYYDFSPKGDPSMIILPSKQIVIQDANQEPIPIKEKDIFTPRKNLGHYTAWSGNSNTQIKTIMIKVQEISKAIHRIYTTHNEARIMHKVIYIPAVEYTLTKSFISEAKLKVIEQKTLPKSHSKCGFNRNSSRATLQAPREIGGVGYHVVNVQ